MSRGPVNVAVVGGGYAGMAAALTLSEHGIPLTVYEAAAHLGGRARRVVCNGIALDNGLHVLIGACSEVLRLVQRVNRDGADGLLRLPLDWHLHGRFRMRVPALRPPLHLAGALLTARGLGVRARWSAARFVHALRSTRFELAQDMSVAALLAAHRQDTRAIRYLWAPLCAAALNTPIEQASARIFVKVLRDGFDRTAASSDVLVARRDLTALFPEPAAERVRARGGEILLGHTVTSLYSESGAFSVTARGTTRRHSHVVCALPPHRLLPAIGGISALEPLAATVARFRYHPIYSVYLQYDGRVPLPAPMIGLADGTAHWLFDREAICGQRGLLAAVISAAGAHRALAQDALALRVHAEAAAHFGPLPPLKWHRVIAEKRATFACTVNLHRPSARTALEDFHLAGDYVAGDYPATLEGAARSGVAAARAIIDALR